MVGARIKPLHEEEAAERQRATQAKPGQQVGKVPANLREPMEAGESSEKVAEIVRVSPRLIDSASAVIKSGTPELVKAVDSGEFTVHAASRIAKLVARANLH
jgi:hypothetical protein